MLTVKAIENEDSRIVLHVCTWSIYSTKFGLLYIHVVLVGFLVEKIS